MASFSTKQFFKKIGSPTLLTEFYKTYNIDSFFEITENTPKKNAIEIMSQFHASLSPEQHLETEEVLETVFSLGNAIGAEIFEKVFKEKKKSAVTNIECHTPLDYALYYYLFEKEIFEEAIFLLAFYLKPNYMRYEASDVDIYGTSFSLNELKNELTRIASKERNVVCELTSMITDSVLYILFTYKDSKREDVARIVYMKNEKEVLISSTGSKYEKLIFLDTFLRIICNSGYTEKMESYDLSIFKNKDFDFARINKGTPLLRFTLKAITFSFGDEKQKKKIRLTLPTLSSSNGLTPLYVTLEDLGLTNLGGHTVENVTLSFSFSDKKNNQKSVLVNTSLSSSRSSLCPLFHYHAYARSLLKQASIDQGFIEAVKKEKDDMKKKWEM